MAARDTAPDVGTIIRTARRAAGLTQTQLGSLVAYSAATISRMESGKQPLRDVVALRKIAAALGIPHQRVGLADGPPGQSAHTTSRPGPRVGTNPGREGDEMRRRDLLTGFAAFGGAAAIGIPSSASAAPPSPTAALVSGVQDRLTGGPTGTTASPDALRSMLAAVRADFQHGRYRSLAARLPALIDRAESTAHAIIRPAAQAILAETYTATTQILIKLGEIGMAWMSVDRALLAARATPDPLTNAEAIRELVILNRKADHAGTAIALALEAANTLDVDGPDAPAAHVAMYGALLSTAGYTAAHGGNRDHANHLLDTAARTASRIGDGNHRYTGFGPTSVAVYRIGAAWALGDAGTAIAHAKTVNPNSITLPERRARYWVDVARAYAQWGHPEQTFTALLEAEAAAPEETRARPAVHAIAKSLLTRHHRNVPGITDFTSRLLQHS
ncbi:transcriptional regulator [Actinorhabdospora filicis]|uniref:Transcriptional regulator n=1 Tax=Actinorhabdospora filicis TaxID=1785913 RepID=A0A9W6SUE2_9ACTN|nr:helix-turn-helix transcriptional regulator [Actinorhabdospora filicis]GLZ82119.1 transcriptional regulator [Actinorhabdospora filicis]